MNCPKCKSTNYCKDGKALDRQRYLCRKCRYRYTVKRAKGRADEATKRQALQLYLEGLGFRSIGRILNFSNVTILNWIRSFGKKITQIQNPHAAKVIEIDEMHTYIGSNKTTVGYGLLLIEFKKDFSTAFWVPGADLPE